MSNSKTPSVATDEDSFTIKELLIPKSDYILIEKLPKKKTDSNFGLLYKARMRDAEAVCRVIDFKRLTSYLTEEFVSEMQHLCFTTTSPHVV